MTEAQKELPGQMNDQKSLTGQTAQVSTIYKDQEQVTSQESTIREDQKFGPCHKLNIH